MRPEARKTQSILTKALLVLSAAACFTLYVPPGMAQQEQIEECVGLLNRLQDDEQRKNMSIEELQRAKYCIEIMKKPPPEEIQKPIKIFR